ncbi:MAG: anti-sigma factor [Actinomycetota bacterium]|nr:anti-sigma factor [Actinomycetota bacterium]
MSDERHNLGREPWRERFGDLKEAYALGALSEEERREVEDYLRHHPELHAEVDDLEATANLLALAPQEYEPSPKLRRNLLRSISGSPRATSAAGPFTRQTGLRGLFGPGGLAAAAVFALVTAGMLAWNASLQEENQTLQGELQGQQTYALQGTDAAQEVRGEVVRLGDERAVLIADDLPSPPEGKTYEAWILREDVPEPAGLFEPNHTGAAAALLEGSIEDADAVAVTVEPSGGSSSPTSDPLMTVTI